MYGDGHPSGIRATGDSSCNQATSVANRRRVDSKLSSKNSSPMARGKYHAFTQRPFEKAITLHQRHMKWIERVRICTDFIFSGQEHTHWLAKSSDAKCPNSSLSTACYWFFPQGKKTSTTKPKPKTWWHVNPFRPIGPNMCFDISFDTLW